MRIPTLLLSLPLFALGPSLGAQPTEPVATSARTFRIDVSIRNLDAPPNSVRGQILSLSRFVKYSADGPQEHFYIQQENTNSPNELQFIFEISLGDRNEELFLSIRDVHFSEQFELILDGKDIDLSHRSSLIDAVCQTRSPDLPSNVRRYIFCRRLYFSFADTDESDRFRALKGWFDAWYALVKIPYSIFDFDPDLHEAVNNFESGDIHNPVVVRYRRIFPRDYVRDWERQAKEARLADIRKISPLLKGGDPQTANNINENIKRIYEQLIPESQSEKSDFTLSSVSATKTKTNSVVNGVTKELLMNNSRNIKTLLKSGL